MHQALHIFKKDVRYLRREISLVWALAAIFVVNDQWWVDLLLIVAAVYLIARVIHAEAIPGDRQFWVTRPYRWKSLVGAKLLFILVFVNFPMFIDQFLLLVINRFPLLPSLPGLLWSQVLLTLVCSVPAGALAAMTSGIGAFIFSILVLLAAGFGTERGVFPGPGGLFPLLETWPFQVEWIRDSIAAVGLAVIALFVLHVQYKTRRTFFSRISALSGAVVAAVVYVYVPWPAAFAIQSPSKQHLDPSSVQIVLDPKTAKTHAGNLSSAEPVYIDVSITVNDVPKGTDLRADALTVTLKSDGGRTWKSGGQDFIGLSENSNGTEVVFRGRGLMNRSFFNREQEQPVTLDASLYLTIFGNPRANTIPLQSIPVNTLDGLQCFVDVFNQLLCRSAFRWPARIVDSDTGSFGRVVSYSPFPASLHLNPIETRGATSGPPLSARMVTITVREPISHFQRDVEVRALHLKDLVGPTSYSH